MRLERKAKNSVSSNKRANCSTGGHVGVLIKRFQKEISTFEDLAILYDFDDDDDLLNYYEHLLSTLYYLKTYDIGNYGGPLMKRPIVARIDDYVNDVEVYSKFGLPNKEYLRRLYMSWNFNETYKTTDRHLIRSETAFLITIRRLKYPCTLRMLVTEFGGDEQEISRNINVILDYVYDNLRGLIYNSIHLWKVDFPLFNSKLKEKLLSYGDMEFLENENFVFRVMGFIDNTIFATCSPGTGPAHSGVNAPRKINCFLRQRSFYTGWKHLHGVKIQFVTFPNGMIGDASAVVSVRHNDIFNLNNSELNNRLRNAQQNQQVHYCVYGDSAYDIGASHVTSMFVGNNLDLWKKKMNKRMNICRESIEWINADIKSKFAFLQYSKGLKLEQRIANVAKYITTAALLHNCYNCLNCTITANFFDCMPPTLEQFMQKRFQFNNNNV